MYSLNVVFMNLLMSAELLIHTSCRNISWPGSYALFWPVGMRGASAASAKNARHLRSSLAHRMGVLLRSLPPLTPPLVHAKSRAPSTDGTPCSPRRSPRALQQHLESTTYMTKQMAAETVIHRDASDPPRDPARTAQGCPGTS